MGSPEVRKPRSGRIARPDHPPRRGAATVTTVDGLEGLSIGNLAAHVGMSKSGLYAHFGSKELQLA
jgi:AcrR family transcriptional regulator